MKLLPTVRERGPSGPAKLTVNGKKLLITMLDANGNETRQAYQFSTDDLPTKDKKVPTGKYFVSLSQDTTKIYQIRPLGGMFVCRFTRFAGPEGQLPVPKHVTGTRTSAKGSYTVDELTCLALAEIIDGPYAGMEIPLPLLYARGESGFVEDEDGRLSVRGGGKRIEMLVGFLEATGAWSTSFAWSENVLPAIQAELQKNGKPFVVVLNKGWPDAYSEAPEVGKSKPAAKKTGKKK